jgi:S1-C subfamily serine protease
MRRQSRWLTLIVGTLCSAVAAQDMQCIFEKHKDATVYIEYLYSTGPEGTAPQQGSGFIVSPSGHILTNAHVVTPEQARDLTVVSSSIMVRVGGLDAEPIVATVAPENIDLASDLALLQIAPGKRTTPWPTLPVSYLDSLPVGAGLVGLGFPARSDVAIAGPGSKSSEVTRIDDKPIAWWQTSIPLIDGNSGGPIFGKLGTVVGIAVAKNRYTNLTTYVIPLARAQHLLAKIDVQPATAGICAQFPECRHASHGIEAYSIDVPLRQDSEWIYGGDAKASQPAWCSEYLATLQQQFPSSSFVQIGVGEYPTSYDIPALFYKAKYRYWCSYQRLEGPIFKQAATAACIK